MQSEHTQIHYFEQERKIRAIPVNEQKPKIEMKTHRSLLFIVYENAMVFLKKTSVAKSPI